MSIKLKRDGEKISRVTNKELNRLLNSDQPAKLKQKIRHELRKRNA